MSDAMFVIRTFPNELEAQLAQSVLEANAIPSTLLRDDAAGIMPWLNVLHPVRLVVREGDVELATRLLEEVVDVQEGDAEQADADPRRDDTGA